MISALFIAQSFPKWFVHFWMTFCKNSIRISCQIIFVNKHWPQSCLCPFKQPIKQSTRFNKTLQVKNYNVHVLNYKTIKVQLFRHDKIIIFHLHISLLGLKKFSKSIDKIGIFKKDFSNSGLTPKSFPNTFATNAVFNVISTSSSYFITAKYFPLTHEVVVLRDLGHEHFPPVMTRAVIGVIRTCPASPVCLVVQFSSIATVACKHSMKYTVIKY